MKTNKYLLTVIGFFTGALCGISLVAVLSFSSAPGSSITPVNAADAHAFFKNYMVEAVAYNQVIKGLTLDRSQLDAMNNLIKENAALSGFRIYIGKDNNARKIGIVVGIDGNGKDAVNNTFYSTNAQYFNVCPPVCDVSSPITAN